MISIILELAFKVINSISIIVKSWNAFISQWCCPLRLASSIFISYLIYYIPGYAVSNINVVTVSIFSYNIVSLTTNPSWHSLSSRSMKLLFNIRVPLEARNTRGYKIVLTHTERAIYLVIPLYEEQGGWGEGGVRNHTRAQLQLPLGWRD